jgi:hypothetical protein
MSEPFITVVYPPSSSITNPQKKWESFIWEQQLAQLCSTPRPQDPTKNLDMIQFFINLQEVFRYREAQAMNNQKSVSQENNTPRTR